MMIERVENRSRRERRQVRICRCRAVSSLRTAASTIPVLKPVQHRHLEVRQAPTLAERQKRAAGRDGDDRDPRHAVDQLRVDDDQRAVGSRNWASSTPDLAFGGRVALVFASLSYSETIAQAGSRWIRRSPSRTSCGSVNARSWAGRPNLSGRPRCLSGTSDRFHLNKSDVKSIFL